MSVALAVGAGSTDALAQGAHPSTDTGASGDTRRRTPPGIREGFTIEGATEAWNPRWQPKTGIYDYVIIGAAAGVAVGFNLVPPKGGDFSRYLLFDEAARNTLRLGTLDQRYRVRDASDVGVSVLTTWPVLVDALIGAWWHRGNPEVAKNIALIDFEVISLVAALQGVTTTTLGRERPYGRDCGRSLPEQSVDCENQVRYRSFFSGHASQSFAGASVICVNHIGMGLLGNAGDVVTCAIAFGVAATTATFRMMGDMHFASDVMTGALIGTAIGLGVPLIHGRTVGDATTGLRLKLAPVENGIGLRGTF